ncbi:MAG: serine/threonine protein kinase [Planctomycetota bacterium]|jgi:serine/threonine protein kinase
MPTKGDRDFGEMAVKHKFVEPQEIEKALREQKRLEKEGALLTLDRVVIEMGFMNPFQVEFIQERLNRKVIYCPGCMTKYNVFKYRGDTRVKCRKCSESIEVPKRFSEMEPEERKARADAGKPIYETKAFLGKVVGGYKVIEELGSGEMGVVFKARQLSLDRVVALKVLPAEVTRDKDSVDRFLREAKSAGKLQHPNIVQVYDIGETGGLYYYSMEFIEGKSLASILPPEKAMDLGEALRIVHQIAKALSHAHRYGVLHKDIRPGSILINEEGVAKLADLGLGAGGADPTKGGISGMGTIGGTPVYLSPEQLANVRNASAASDVYSLGATFYRMVTGQEPFTGPNILAVMKAILEDTPPAASELNSSIPKALSDLIARMMARDVADRIRSAEELVEALSSLSSVTGSNRLKKQDRKSSRRWNLGRKPKKDKS